LPAFTKYHTKISAVGRESQKTTEERGREKGGEGRGKVHVTAEGRQEKERKMKISQQQQRLLLPLYLNFS